jgi:hypothetical protein
VKAQAAADARASFDKANALALQAEMNQAESMRQAKIIADSQPRPVSTTSQGSAASAKVNVAAIQSQISSLNADIAFMQAQEAKTANNGHVLVTDGNKITKGAYADKIADEQAEVNELQSQLNGQ